MAMMPPRRCSTCHTSFTASRCPVCVRQFDRRRGSGAARGYDAEWRKLRAWHLLQFPLCADCEQENRVTTAVHVHHVVDIADDPSRRLDPSNLQSLCVPCHSRRTAAKTFTPHGGGQIASKRRPGDRPVDFSSARQVREGPVVA